MAETEHVVAEGRVVAIEYTVVTEGKTIEQTEAGRPVQYLHGARMLLPSLEAALEGLKAGDQKKFELAPKDAYGIRDESNVLTLPRTIFREGTDLVPGARLAAKTHTGETYPLTVLEVFVDRVVVDLNHPLAGKTLAFDVKVAFVRPAGNDEVFVGRPRPVEVV